MIWRDVTVSVLGGVGPQRFKAASPGVLTGVPTPAWNAVQSGRLLGAELPGPALGPGDGNPCAQAEPVVADVGGGRRAVVLLGVGQQPGKPVLKGVVAGTSPGP